MDQEVSTEESYSDCYRLTFGINFAVSAIAYGYSCHALYTSVRELLAIEWQQEETRYAYTACLRPSGLTTDNDVYAL